MTYKLTIRTCDPESVISPSNTVSVCDADCSGKVVLSISTDYSSKCRMGCPQAGQPRGYAFVTYKTIEDAEAAKDALHNLKVGAKNIVVRWAHSVTEPDIEKPKPKIDIPALAGAKKDDKKISRETAIQAIEAKLKLMKESEEEFELNKPLDGSPIIHLYQRTENQKPSTSTRHHNWGNHHHNNKPYNRYKPRR
ncbi:hypothetical protein HZH68_005458 [Vespula germanica]|uniref:RRM domain-containing protein n=1 Tax=Vespula germanica TaxID=30212 RepID=A0A834KDR4_VESGE|nr:hypothetical protein HZH68_005458 [Vespula germanica]